MLLWKAIEEAKCGGLLEFDMGRSESDNRGLTDFKRRWGAAQSEMVYLRYRSSAGVARMRLARQIFGLVPDGVIGTVGRAFYRHLG